jgi:DNA modification methylase
VWWRHLVTVRILTGHVLDRLADLPVESVHCVVTSPPYYGLRDYGIEPQIWGDGWRGSLGLEPTPALYVEHMVAVFAEVRRVLRRDGTLWLNIGDSYATAGGYGGDQAPSNVNGKQRTNQDAREKGQRPRVTGFKHKDLLGMPWMLAFALRDDGWWLRSEITWAKRAPMPESVTDRPTNATEKVFLLTKSARYFYDAEAVKEECGDNTHPYTKQNTPKAQIAPVLDKQRNRDAFSKEMVSLRNMRNWWLLGPEPFPEAHFATFPTEIPRRAILAGTSERGVCPKCGAQWDRVVRSEKRDGSSPTRNDGASKRSCGNVDRNDSEDARSYTVSETLGWRPACSCAAGDPVPATVLDPFLGAGTTALVADQLQRHAIGIELNPDYAEMAERRIHDDAPLFASVRLDYAQTNILMSGRDVAPVRQANGIDPEGMTPSKPNTTIP